MKNFNALGIILISCFFTNAYAQKKTNSATVKPTKAVTAPVAISDPVLVNVAGQNITRSEFERVYYKNNNKGTANDEKSIRDYMELFINYKLKVKEAESLKMDTSAAFKDELTGYRKQLAQPYLTDKDVNDNLVKEAYNRLQNDVRASHILIKLSSDALPKDTLAAYNRIMKIREKIVKGADFEKMARDSSEDPSAKDNGGDLGYFTGIMVATLVILQAYKWFTLLKLQPTILNPVRCQCL